MSDIKGFAKEHKGFTAFIAVQLVILFLAFAGLFGEAVNMEFDAGSLEIADPKAVVGDDNSIYITGKGDAEPFGRWIAGSEPFNLREGMYEVSVNYRSHMRDSEDERSFEDSAGSIQILREKEIIDKLCYNDIALQDSWESRNTRLWIRGIGGEKGLQLKVAFHGLGELRVDKITIRELMVWRFMKLLAWMLGFATADLALWYFFFAKDAQNKAAAALLAAASFLVNLPMFTDFLFDGHDLDFHLTRIAALADGLAAGHIFVPIQTEVFNGYGYAAPLFYSQLFLYLPAVLYNLAVPLQTCYQVYVIFVNIATVLIAYYSFNGIAKDKKIAAAGAFIYAFAAYRITNVYLRAAVGEYTAMAFLPLVVCGFARVYAKDEKDLKILDCFPIVIGLTGIIESHMLSCEMSAIFIGAVCIAYFRKTFSARRFFILGSAALMTLLANMAFILPFADSMGMNIRVNNVPAVHTQGSGTYLLQVFNILEVGMGNDRWGMHGEMPLSLGFAILLGGGIFIVCISMRKEWNIKKDGIYRIGVTCILLAAASIIMSMRIFPWDSLANTNTAVAKVLCMVQFPWRYLSMATVFATVAAVSGLAIIKASKGTRVLDILIGMLCVISYMTFALYMDGLSDAVDERGIYGGADLEKTVMVGEYVLEGTYDAKIGSRKVKYDADFVSVENYIYEGGITTFDCTNAADVEMPVEIPLMNYDNYHAYDVESGAEIGIMNGTDNRVSLAVPARFAGRIKVVYRFPLTWKIAYAISALSVIAFAALCIMDRRKDSARQTDARKKVGVNGL